MSSTLEQPTTEHLLTAEEFADRIDEFGPAELVKGRVVPMSLNNVTHAAIIAKAAYHVGSYLRMDRPARLLAGDVGIYTARNPDTARGADLAVISHEQFSRRDPGKAFLTVAPELVIEVISPDNRWQDVTDKLAEFFEIGVREVWLVNPSRREVSVYNSLTEVRLLAASRGDLLSCEALLPGLSIPVGGLFEDL